MTEFVPLGGGNLSAAVRVGDTVERNAGPWTPTVHRLLHHLRAHGLTWVPRPLPTLEPGREVVSYLPGTVPQYPMPPWVWHNAVLVNAATKLAAFHAASRDFDLTGGIWQLPARTPYQVVCHNDFAPYNLVFDADHVITGVIDCDTASPGPRVWDLAYLAYRLVPMSRPDNPDSPDLDLTTRRDRLLRLCRAYGHDLGSALVVATAVERVRDLAAFTAARASAGAKQLAAHTQHYRDDADWLSEHQGHLA